MFDPKILLTVILTFFLLVVLLGGSPAVTGFFGYLGDRAESLTGMTAPRDIEFSLSADRYEDVVFSAKNPVNFTIVGDTSAILNSGNLVTNKTLAVYGFRGSGSVRNNTVVLDGKITKVELPEIAVAVQETIKSNSTFTTLVSNGLEVKELVIRGTAGTITTRNAITEFSGDIYVTAPAGAFRFENGMLIIDGMAAKISVPSAGLLID